MSVTLDPPVAQIAWSRYRQVPVPLRANLDALTQYRITLDGQPQRGTDSQWALSGVRTKLTFRADSWVVRGRQSDPLLAHEVLHYRIAALVVEELDKAAVAVRSKDAKSLADASKALLDQSLTRCQRIQDDYDAKTNHGRIAFQQTLWDRTVDRWEAGHKITWPI